MSRGKKYRESAAQFDRQHLYTPAEAVDLIKSSAKASFDETVELAVRLGVDPRKADQIVRGTLSLPAGTGRTARVAVFAAGEKAAEARAAGADVVGADDLVARVANDGFLDFDVAIATPDLMGQVGTLGRVLGPRGLMPNPKTGTVTDDVERAVIEFKGGGWSTGPTRWATSTSGSARRRSTGPSSWRTSMRSWRRSTGPSRPPPRAAT